LRKTLSFSDPAMGKGHRDFVTRFEEGKARQADWMLLETSNECRKFTITRLHCHIHLVQKHAITNSFELNQRASRSASKQKEPHIRGIPYSILQISSKEIFASDEQ
jgi:hypothetical protein